MASGRFTLSTAYNSSSPNCVDAYVDWTSTNTSGSSHTVTMKLYAARIDYTGSTTIQYGAPSGSGWTRTYTNSSLIFSGGAHVHICTVQTTVTSNSSGVASFSGADFYAGFYSSSYGTRRMSGSITQLTLDKPKVSVNITSPTGITCTSSNSTPSVGDQITFTVTITDNKKYSKYSLSVTGATLVSGTTYKVTGNVSVTVTGTLKTYLLSITQSNGVTVNVTGGGKTYESGQYIEYGTKLTITVQVNSGFTFGSFVVDGSSYAVSSVVSVTVSAAVTVEVTATQSGTIYINDGDGFHEYQVFVYTNKYGWKQYIPYVFSDGAWHICGSPGGGGGTGGGGTVPEPVYTYTVDPIAGVTYGFMLNANGYYESTNKGVQSSYSLCRVSFTFDSEKTITLRLINYAESSYDYGIIGNWDTPMSLSNSADSGRWSGSGQQSPTPVDLSLTVPAGSHFIDIKYRKDGSVDSGNDSLQFMLIIP